MRTLVLYESRAGSTKKYAEAIASGIHGDVFPLKKFKWKTLPEYDCVVFGGWVMGGTIQGLNKFIGEYLTVYEEIGPRPVLIYGCGMSIPTKEGRATLISQNVLDLYHVRFYQLRGSFDFSKLSFVHKIMMNASLKQTANDPDPNKQALLTIKDHPIEYYDAEGVNKILSVLHRIASEPIEVKVEDKQ